MCQTQRHLPKLAPKIFGTLETTDKKTFVLQSAIWLWTANIIFSDRYKAETDPDKGKIQYVPEKLRSGNQKEKCVPGHWMSGDNETNTSSTMKRYPSIRD